MRDFPEPFAQMIEDDPQLDVFVMVTTIQADLDRLRYIQPDNHQLSSEIDQLQTKVMETGKKLIALATPTTGTENPARVPIERRLHTVDLVVVANGHVDGRERDSGVVDHGRSPGAVKRRGATRGREDLIHRV